MTTAVNLKVTVLILVKANIQLVKANIQLVKANIQLVKANIQLVINSQVLAMCVVMNLSKTINMVTVGNVTLQ
jgi:hypothetical protein